jgi:hypothetical protein
MPSTSAAFVITVNPIVSRATTTTTILGDSSIIVGQTATITAAASVPLAQYRSAGTGTISFFEGATLLATKPAEPGYCGPPCSDPQRVAFASLSLPNLSVGTHAITATYSGDSIYMPSTSAAFVIAVSPAPITTGLSFSGPTATSSGFAQVTMQGGGPICGFTRAAFIPAVGNPLSPPVDSAPPGTLFLDGLIYFVTSGCVPGSTLTFVLTLPRNVPPGTEYWKYGPTPGNVTPHWYVIPSSIFGNRITFTITDGGLGDDDLTVNGTIVDQGGPGSPASPAGIPTLLTWTKLALGLLLLAIGMIEVRARTRA